MFTWNFSISIEFETWYAVVICVFLLPVSTMQYHALRAMRSSLLGPSVGRVLQNGSAPCAVVGFAQSIPKSTTTQTLPIPTALTSTSFCTAATTATSETQPSISNAFPSVADMAFGGDVPGIVYDGIASMTPVEFVSLSGSLFNAPVRPDVVHQTVVWQLAKRRAGTASTKTRSEVSYSGRKVRPQKGSGRSRQGTRGSPIFVGGGRAHGPKPRDWGYNLPRNIVRNAITCALSSKVQHGQLWVLNSVEMEDFKTKHLLKCFQEHEWRSVCIVYNDDDNTDNLLTAARTLQRVLPIHVDGINVYDMLRFDHLVMSKNAMQSLEARFRNYSWLI